VTKSATILALLEQGYNPQQIALKVDCSDAYVRAVRQRATPEGRERSRALQVEAYWRKKEADPESWRQQRSDYYRPYHREWRRRKANADPR
jgi:hypothetical protein